MKLLILGGCQLGEGMEEMKDLIGLEIIAFQVDVVTSLSMLGLMVFLDQYFLFELTDEAQFIKVYFQ